LKAWREEWVEECGSFSKGGKKEELLNTTKPKGPYPKSSHLLSQQPSQRGSITKTFVSLSHDLSWHSHISKLASKARRRLGIVWIAPFEVSEGKQTPETVLTRHHQDLEGGR